MNRTPTLPRFIYLLIVVVAYFASVGSQRVTAQATSFTVSGTVTNTNGQGLADVMVILISDVAGAQIAFTNQSGNYVLNYAGGVSHTFALFRQSRAGFSIRS